MDVRVRTCSATAQRDLPPICTVLLFLREGGGGRGAPASNVGALADNLERNAAWRWCLRIAAPPARGGMAACVRTCSATAQRDLPPIRTVLLFLREGGGGGGGTWRLMHTVSKVYG